MSPPSIDRLYAWIITDEHGQDSIPAFLSSAGPAPMMGGSRQIMEALQGVAQGMCSVSGGTMRLVEFGSPATLLAVSAEGGSRPH